MLLQKYKIIICLEKMSALQYYDFSGKNKFGEYDSRPTKIQESMKNFEHDGPSPMDMTTTNLITNNLYKTRKPPELISKG